MRLQITGNIHTIKHYPTDALASSRCNREGPIAIAVVTMLFHSDNTRSVILHIQLIMQSPEFHIDMLILTNIRNREKRRISLKCKLVEWQMNVINKHRINSITCVWDDREVHAGATRWQGAHRVNITAQVGGCLHGIDNGSKRDNDLVISIYRAQRQHFAIPIRLQPTRTVDAVNPDTFHPIAFIRGKRQHEIIPASH